MGEGEGTAAREPQKRKYQETHQENRNSGETRRNGASFMVEEPQATKPACNKKPCGYSGRTPRTPALHARTRTGPYPYPGSDSSPCTRALAIVHGILQAALRADPAVDLRPLRIFLSFLSYFLVSYSIIPHFHHFSTLPLYIILRGCV